MENLENIARLIAEKHVEQGALVATVRHGDFRAETADGPLIPDLITDLLVVRGSMRAVIDKETVTCTAERNNVLTVKPMHVVADITLSEDFEGCLLILSKLFMDIAEKGTHAVPFRDIIQTRSIHAITVTKRKADALRKYFRLLRQNVSATEYPVDQAIFQHAALLFHLKIVQQLCDQTRHNLDQEHVSRSSSLCDRFLSLVDEHVERRHDVAFYAEQLNITPHYLTRLTKRFVSSTANQVIDRELVSRASNLLRNPDLSLQQVADRLNFSDQSSFGKFFKKHTGKSPGIYRSEISLPITDSPRQ